MEHLAPSSAGDQASVGWLARSRPQMPSAASLPFGGKTLWLVVGSRQISRHRPGRGVPLCRAPRPALLWPDRATCGVPYPEKVRPRTACGGISNASASSRPLSARGCRRGTRRVDLGGSWPQGASWCAVGAVAWLSDNSWAQGASWCAERGDGGSDSARPRSAAWWRRYRRGGSPASGGQHSVGPTPGSGYPRSRRVRGGSSWSGARVGGEAVWVAACGVMGVGGLVGDRGPSGLVAIG